MQGFCPWNLRLKICSLSPRFVSDFVSHLHWEQIRWPYESMLLCPWSVQFVQVKQVIISRELAGINGSELSFSLNLPPKLPVQSMTIFWCHCSFNTRSSSVLWTDIDHRWAIGIEIGFAEEYEAQWCGYSQWSHPRDLGLTLYKIHWLRESTTGNQYWGQAASCIYKCIQQRSCWRGLW